MPAGVIAVLTGDGFAVIEFTDPALRGQGLHRLLEIGGPATVETLTREGRTRKYRVPEGNAREAGLLDEHKPAAKAEKKPPVKAAAKPVTPE